MSSRENHLQPPIGICRRIYNFIVNEVIAIGLKRVPLSLSKPNEEEKARLWDHGGPTNGADSEAIKVQFKVNEDDKLVDWRPIDYDMLGAGGGGGGGVQSKGKRVLIPVSSTGPAISFDVGSELAARNGRGPRRGISFKDSVDEDKAAIRGKNVVAATVEVEMKQAGPEDHGVRRPINLLAQNINEKSDSFIRRKKELMRRHLSMELKER